MATAHSRTAQSRKVNYVVLTLGEKGGSEDLNSGHRDTQQGVGCATNRCPRLIGWRLCTGGEAATD